MNNTTNDTSCEYEAESYMGEKMVVIVGFGTLIATVGIATNGILVYLFLSKRSYRRTHFVYMGALALNDIWVCICFVLLFVVKVLYDFIDSRWLYLLFHDYVRVLFTLTQIVQTASTYMIIAATAERFLAVFNMAQVSSTSRQGHRFGVIAAVLLFAFVSRMSTYFELVIIVMPECIATFKYLHLASRPFVHEEPYNTAYRLYFNNIVHIFLPFLLLLFFNVAILVKLRAALRMRTAMIQMSMGANVAQERKESLKAATTTLVAIVTTYLACNVLGFALTILEHIDMQILLANEKFYTFASNTVSMLHLLNSAIRMFIYFACNKQIRKSLRGLFKRNNVRRKTGIDNGTPEEVSFLTNHCPTGTPNLPMKEYIYIKDSTV